MSHGEPLSWRWPREREDGQQPALPLLTYRYFLTRMRKMITIRSRSCRILGIGFLLLKVPTGHSGRHSFYTSSEWARV
jgi:hypothetical protein